MRRVGIVGNEADAGAGRSPWGAGAVLSPWGESTLVVEDVRFEANNLVEPFAGPAGLPPSALDVSAAVSGAFVLDRIEIVGGDADWRTTYGCKAPSGNRRWRATFW